MHSYTQKIRKQKEIKETIPFTIVTKRIKYLGIYLPKKPKDLHWQIHFDIWQNQYDIVKLKYKIKLKKKFKKRKNNSLGKKKTKKQKNKRPIYRKL